MLLFWLWPIVVNACDRGGHHSTLYHHNRSIAICIAKPQTRVLNGQQQLKFKVSHWFKTDSMAASTTLWVALPPEKVDRLYRRTSYLLYLTLAREQGYLYCGQPLPLTDSSALRQVAYLKQLGSNYTGTVVEPSPYGQPWAVGRLENGEPVGEWRYYAYSGELKLKGTHRLDTATWEGYHHTSDATYEILEKIRTGQYYAQTGDYRLLGVDSLVEGLYRYCLHYTVGNDTLTEYWSHRITLLAERVHYQGGWRFGWEERYSLEGDCIRRYHFWKGWLDGAFWERQTLSGNRGHVEIKGHYARDEKQEEQHWYYDPNGRLERKVMMVENGRVTGRPIPVETIPEVILLAPHNTP